MTKKNTPNYGWAQDDRDLEKREALGNPVDIESDNGFRDLGGIMFERCVIQGDAPEGYASWDQWVAQGHPYRGVTIRASIPEDWKTAPTPDLDSDGKPLLAAPQPAPATGDEREALSEDQWLALAERHASADWNSDQPDGFLSAVKALVADAMSLPASAAHRREDRRDAVLDQVMTERDAYHDRADKLAEGIAEFFGVEIGEHSNLNCPWQNAEEWLGSREALAMKTNAARYQFIKQSGLILSGGHQKFGWPISPFGEQCDKYIDAAMQRTAAPAHGEPGALEQGDAL